MPAHTGVRCLHSRTERPRPSSHQASRYRVTMRIHRILAAAAASALLLVTAAPAQAASDVMKVTVYHQAVSPTQTTGTGIGAVRTFMSPIAVDGKAADGQYFTGTLTTLATGIKGDQEIRSSNLTFVIGSETNQLVIGGISLYPAAGATIAPGTRTTRPIIGGSGTYDGARGQVVSTNLGADGWTHVFLIKKPA